MIAVEQRIRAALSRYKIRNRWPDGPRYFSKPAYAVFDGEQDRTGPLPHGEARKAMEDLLVADLVEIAVGIDHCDTPSSSELAE